MSTNKKPLFFYVNLAKVSKEPSLMQMLCLLLNWFTCYRQARSSASDIPILALAQARPATAQ